MKQIIWLSAFAICACTVVGIQSYYQQKKLGTISELYTEQNDDSLHQDIKEEKQLELEDYSRGPLRIVEDEPIKSSPIKDAKGNTPNDNTLENKTKAKNVIIKKEKNNAEKLLSVNSADLFDSENTSGEILESSTDTTVHISATNERDTTITQTITYRSFSRAPLPKQKSKGKFISTKKDKE